MSNDENSPAMIVHRLALIAEAMERRAKEAVQEQQRATQALQQALVAVRDEVDRTVQASLAQVTQTVQQSLDGAMSRSTARHDQTVNDIAARLHASAQGFEQSGVRVNAAAQHKLLMAYLAIGGALALLLLGGFGAIWYQWQSFAEAHARAQAVQLDAATMETYAQVGITSCGGRPCIRLDQKSPRWGEHGEYVLLAPGNKAARHDQG